MLAWVLSAVAHVPTYDGACDGGCCTPPHHHDLSQVIYLRGSGGLELHVEDLDVAGGEELDVDVVFRDTPDNTTYALYIGCGGCAEDDPLLAPRVRVHGYESAELEPFTQTAYRSIFKKADRKYDASALAGCTSKHFTIRLVQYANCSKDIVWGPVIGLAESFTFRELAEFPLFILANHGYAWNEMAYSWWLIVTVVLLSWRLLLVAEDIDGRSVTQLRAVRTAHWEWRAHEGAYRRVVLPVSAQAATIRDWRALLYSIAMASFVAAAVEELYHLLYAQSIAAFGWQFWVGLIGVIGVGQGFPYYLTVLIWNSMLCVDDFRVARGEEYSVWTTLRFLWWVRWHPYFAFLEMASGFSFLFLFGAGFYAGPACLMLAGLIRLGELSNPASTYLGRGDGGSTTHLLVVMGTPKDEEEKEEPEVPMGKPVAYESGAYGDPPSLSKLKQ